MDIYIRRAIHATLLLDMKTLLILIYIRSHIIYLHCCCCCCCLPRPLAPPSSCYVLLFSQAPCFVVHPTRSVRLFTQQTPPSTIRRRFAAATATFCCRNRSHSKPLRAVRGPRSKMFQVSQGAVGFEISPFLLLPPTCNNTNCGELLSSVLWSTPPFVNFRANHSSSSSLTRIIDVPTPSHVVVPFSLFRCMQPQARAPLVVPLGRKRETSKTRTTTFPESLPSSWTGVWTTRRRSAIPWTSRFRTTLRIRSLSASMTRPHLLRRRRILLTTITCPRRR